jgi:class 3 adenylate cyclase
MPGGYAPIGTLDQGMQAARAIAMAAIYAREPTRSAVENVEVSLQVVAGYNYAFAISLAGGAHYHVTVFRSPQSAFSVTRLEKAD